MQRNSTFFFIALFIGALLFCLLFIDASISRRIDDKLVRDRREMVKVLNLTDLCLFTEARYARHPAMADLQTAFQDHPLALEHFPSGSLMAIPPHLRLHPARTDE